jgi:probable HAF family extracellular repeat protein
MYQIKRINHSTMGKSLVLCAFALALLGGTSVALYSGVSGSTEQLACAPLSANFSPIVIQNARQVLANGINDLGQIVGRFEDADRLTHGFLLNGSSLTLIDFGEALDTAAIGINNLGQIVGNYVDKKEKLHGFLYENDEFTPINFQNADETAALGINDSGDIIGYYIINGGPFQAYIRKNGVYETFNIPNSSYIEPSDINNFGHIVGERGIGATSVAFLRLKGDIFSDLSISCTTTTLSSAAGINDFGHIVGVYRDRIGVSHGFHSINVNGVPTTIDFPGASGPSIDIPELSGTVASSINNNGQIVGSYVNTAGLIQGFLATIEGSAARR